MALKIDASGIAERRYLEVHGTGVTFNPASLWGSKTFPFREIVCVLMSDQDVLSFQVGLEVYTIQTDAGNEKHQETIKALLGELAASIR
jgi:hypothetical protein